MKNNNGMSLIGKIVGANLVLMILYTVAAMGTQDHAGGGVVIGAVMAMYHAGIAFVISMILFIVKQNDWAKGLLLSAFLLAGIGFSFCVGAVATMHH
ncbi:MAG: hypothetical protein GY810_31660 [Aureispira sp.]|nr:hypothetical protein [Aureispira sp.]